MKKSELIEGEEYAIYLDPHRARSGYRTMPLKATLLHVKGKIEEEYRVTAKFVNRDYRQMIDPLPVPVTETATQAGIVVKLDTPLRNGNYISPSDSYVHEGRYALNSYEAIEAYDPATGYRNSDPKLERKTRSLTVLKNAGCFLSTWAEYEAEEKAKADAKEQRKAEMARMLAEAQANEVKVLKNLAAALLGFERAGFVASNNQDSDYAASKITLKPMFLPEAKQATVTLRYFNNPYRVDRGDTKQHPLLGFQVEMPDYALLLLLTASAQAGYVKDRA